MSNKMKSLDEINSTYVLIKINKKILKDTIKYNKTDRQADD